RARGPSLAEAGVSDALANPRLQLVRMADQTVIESNDDWQAAANAQEISASGFAPGHALESAIHVTLQPGAYTAILTDAGGLGVGLLEVFEVDAPDAPLIGISTRATVQAGSGVMIAGFVI